MSDERPLIWPDDYRPKRVPLRPTRDELLDLVAEKDAEIERLRKALDQAVNWPELYDIGKKIYEILIHPTASVTAFETWELGDALKKARGERPPSSGVQSGVQGPSEPGQNEGESA